MAGSVSSSYMKDIEVVGIEEELEKKFEGRKRKKEEGRGKLEGRGRGAM